MPDFSPDLEFTTGTPTPGGVGSSSPLWRYFIARLNGAGLTDYSKLASDRVIEVLLNGPLSMRGTVPSDNPQVFIEAGDDDPYLTEGTRLLWGFRRESNVPPYYVVRAATLMQLVGDAAQQDDARTSFTGWDPWHYMFSRPVCNFDGSLPGPNGLSFTDTQAATVIETLLDNTFQNHGHTFIDLPDIKPDGSVNSGASGFWDGTIQTGPGMEIDVNFQQGTSVGQALQQVCSMAVCDIIMEPVYDPYNRANYLVQVSVYSQVGEEKPEQIFAWNMPGRSLVGLNRQQDGSQRANAIKFFAGQGGSAPGGQDIAVQEDSDSQDKYGVYYAQQFFPGENVDGAVLSLAQQQLALRALGKTTVTFKPAPERSPRPWLDYDLGDRVPVWASNTGFRQFLSGSSGTNEQYQRIYGWTLNISDDALETVDPMLTSPQTGEVG